MNDKKISAVIITFNEDELEKMIDVKSIFEIVSNK